MSKPVDKWPAAWKRPFYGPDVIGERFIRAGRKLVEEPMSSKTVEQAYQEWLKANPDANGWQEGPPYSDAFAAGVAHGAAEEREVQESTWNSLFAHYCYLCERGNIPERTISGKWMHEKAAMGCGASDLREQRDRIRQRGEK